MCQREDEIVLAVANMQNLVIKELWTAYDAGNYFHYIPVHTIAHELEPEKAKALPVFYALNVTSFLSNKGKKSAWDAWSVIPKLTEFDNIVIHQMNFYLAL